MPGLTKDRPLRIDCPNCDALIHVWVEDGEINTEAFFKQTSKGGKPHAVAQGSKTRSEDKKDDKGTEGTETGTPGTETGEIQTDLDEAFG